MSSCAYTRPIPVTCHLWYSLLSDKAYSSSTIFFHNKRWHPSEPPSFSPSKTTCPICQTSIAIVSFLSHIQSCKQSVSPSIPIHQPICLYCNRTFNQERLAKHQAICEFASKKRPLFNSAKKRVPLLYEAPKADTRPRRRALKLEYHNSKWQKEHLSLMKNLRAEPATDLYSEYTQCPSCQRFFGPKVAETHLEMCKHIINKPKPPPSIIQEGQRRIRSKAYSLAHLTKPMKFSILDSQPSIMTLTTASPSSNRKFQLLPLEKRMSEQTSRIPQQNSFLRPAIASKRRFTASRINQASRTLQRSHITFEEVC